MYITLQPNSCTTPAYSALSVCKFLATKKMTIISHLLYSPNLSIG